MSNSTFPLDPAHPLAVGSDLLQTHGLLLYSGQMTGRWFNVTTTTTRGSRQPVTVTERQLDVAGTGRVTLELSPDPHFDWLFAHDGLVPVHQWPVLVPPSTLSNEFASRVGPTGLPQNLPRPVVAVGTRRIEGANWIGDVDTLLDEVRFYLVNFQVWFLTENITRGSVVDRDAGMTLRANGWRIDVERRQEFSDAMRHMEDNRALPVPVPLHAR